MKLEGRYAFITGASMGLGAAIAEEFLVQGASIFLCARRLDKLEELKAKLLPRLREGRKVEVFAADITKPAEVDRAVAVALDAFPHIEILINNAGIYGPMGTIEQVDWTEWVSAINTNLMGTAYCTRALLPHFRKRRYGKIINLSGGGATSPMPNISAYAASKAAVVRLTETLALEVRDDGIDVNAVAPGTLDTQMMDQLKLAGPDKAGRDFWERMMELRRRGTTPLSKPVGLCVYLASAESDGISGKLISAVWDPWTELQKHRGDLDGSDIYALRRIIPKDRGKTWGA